MEKQKEKRHLFFMIGLSFLDHKSKFLQGENIVAVNNQPSKG